MPPERDPKLRFVVKWLNDKGDGTELWQRTARRPAGSPVSPFSPGCPPGHLAAPQPPLYTFYQRPGEPMSLSAVIVDDEQLARDELVFLLKNVGDIEVVAQGKN